MRAAVRAAVRVAPHLLGLHERTPLLALAERADGLFALVVRDVRGALTHLDLQMALLALLAARGRLDHRPQVCRRAAIARDDLGTAVTRRGVNEHYTKLPQHVARRSPHVVLEGEHQLTRDILAVLTRLCRALEVPLEPGDAHHLVVAGIVQAQAEQGHTEERHPPLRGVVPEGRKRREGLLELAAAEQPLHPVEALVVLRHGGPRHDGREVVLEVVFEEDERPRDRRLRRVGVRQHAAVAGEVAVDVQRATKLEGIRLAVGHALDDELALLAVARELAGDAARLLLQLEDLDAHLHKRLLRHGDDLAELVPARAPLGA